MAKIKACPFAIRVWSTKDRQFDAGCFFDGKCTGDPKCEHFEEERRRRVREILKGGLTE